MYIRNGIAYAGEEAPMLKVNGVRPLDNHKLWLRFNTGEARVFDFTPLLSKPSFALLADMSVFKGVYIDYGIPVWNDGDIDIAPETLYEQSVPANVLSVPEQCAKIIDTLIEKRKALGLTQKELAE